MVKNEIVMVVREKRCFANIYNVFLPSFCFEHHFSPWCIKSSHETKNTLLEYGGAIGSTHRVPRGNIGNFSSMYLIEIWP